MLGLDLGLNFAGGSAGAAVSGGGPLANAANIVFPGGSVGATSTAGAAGGMSLTTWLLIAAAAGVASYFLVKHM